MTCNACRRAFTLIELLIVVAIIAILAAIAVPNFLEAQTRAKVSRVKADMRSTATALEAYAVDHNTYPWGADSNDLRVPAQPPTDPFECHLPTLLTTPVAYMTSLFQDVFWNQKAGHGAKAPLHYNESRTIESLGEPNFLPALSTVLLGAPNTAIRWYMFSHGPDCDHDESLDGSVPDLATALYDPTNGTKSNGDIYMFGPGLSLQ